MIDVVEVMKVNMNLRAGGKLLQRIGQFRQAHKGGCAVQVKVHEVSGGLLKVVKPMTGDAPEAIAIPRHSGSATRNTTIEAKKSFAKSLRLKFKGSPMVSLCLLYPALTLDGSPRL